jgi:hypothetical protein
MKRKIYAILITSLMFSLPVFSEGDPGGDGDPRSTSASQAQPSHGAGAFGYPIDCTADTPDRCSSCLAQASSGCFSAGCVYDGDSGCSGDINPQDRTGTFYGGGYCHCD